MQLFYLRIPRVVFLLLNLTALIVMIFSFYKHLEWLSHFSFLSQVMSIIYFFLLSLLGLRTVFFCKQILCSIVILLISVIFIKFTVSYLQIFVYLNIVIAIWMGIWTHKYNKIREQVD